MKDSKIIMEELLNQVNGVLENESKTCRPVDNNNRPGGIVILRQDLTTLIVPDLHGRADYLPDLVRFKYKGKRVFDLLSSKKIQIVCVGDGMHGERRVAARWKTALEEYKKGFSKCPAMAEEMSENFQTMAMVMRLKIHFPDLFHFLKGNHENIMDENGNGNHPFSKFAAEGPMTRLYIEMFYGSDFLNLYNRFEKNLPLMARGGFFIISHSRPGLSYKTDEIINYRSFPGVIEGLTWTRHQAARSGSTIEILDRIIGDSPGQRLWFVGHTAIKNKYTFWEKESLFEIHNPGNRSLVIVDPLETFEPEKNIVVLPEAGRKDEIRI